MRNIHKKTTVLEPLFNKVALNFFIKKRPQHRYFPVNKKIICEGNINKSIIGQRHINSLRNKFDCLVQQITGNVDILRVSETKLDNSLNVGQLLIDGYGPPIRLDREIHGGGLMLFVREDIPCKVFLWKINPGKVFT